jgi:hypothetical protein
VTKVVTEVLRISQHIQGTSLFTPIEFVALNERRNPWNGGLTKAVYEVSSENRSPVIIEDRSSLTIRQEGLSLDLAENRFSTR